MSFNMVISTLLLHNKSRQKVVKGLGLQQYEQISTMIRPYSCSDLKTGLRMESAR